MFGIRDPRSGIRKKFIPDPWGKKAPDPDPQHCLCGSGSHTSCSDVHHKYIFKKSQKMKQHITFFIHITTSMLYKFK
jgi:hypothetical protein